MSCCAPAGSDAPVGPGTAGAIRHNRVETIRLPSRQERSWRPHTRRDRSDNRHKAIMMVESAPSMEPDRNPLAESPGNPSNDTRKLCVSGRDGCHRMWSAARSRSAASSILRPVPPTVWRSARAPRMPASPASAMASSTRWSMSSSVVSVVSGGSIARRNASCRHVPCDRDRTGCVVVRDGRF